ncbi:hypothetical protein DR864_22920 [Runella rosea]|uniref:LamG-like jellyroll fold domain-containing protein n=1 Tax=Runella rosea TaxID=2259595 RepID=A0A344TP20_9BACT|nr:LamG-like jellyroll fold domain-containing protein [Runella rosea]AXE20391.1 hypothetical protein DR864_22920 [Runella rosea]
MKISFLFLFISCSWAVQAQIQAFNFAQRNTFYGIGGYAFTQQGFSNGVQANPYLVLGPSPQNVFSYAVSAVGGITNRSNAISTNTANTPISIQLHGNNVRKFSCQPVALNTFGNPTSDDIQLTATTNLGNTATQTGGFNSGAFVGFSVTGNENEYIVSIAATFPTTPSPAAFLTLAGIMVGDNTPQNVALHLDGVNDYVSIPNNVGNFAANQEFTVTCWVKPDPTQTDIGQQDNDFLEKWDGTGGYPFVMRYLNQTAGANNGKVQIARYDGTNGPNIMSTAKINDGQWHHVAMTVASGSPKTMSLYIDGILQGSVTDNTNATTTNNSPLYIGVRGIQGRYFKGEIDEIRIWNVAKTATQLADERFCKTPNATNLQAAYNFSNGVPHGTNTLISQINEASNSANNGTLNNFAKTGDASNFVTGQVKYVNNTPNIGNKNGSSWANAYDNLRSALTDNTCNDLFEIYVAKGTSAYKSSTTNNINDNFNILSGMRIYGGFAGTEKSINKRNLALINSTNETTLSGDLGSNDTPFVFTSNRNDNSYFVVNIGNDVVFDGFKVIGGRYDGIFGNSVNCKISNCRITDNEEGLNIRNSNKVVANCIITGNSGSGIYDDEGTSNYQNCLIANNGQHGISFINYYSDLNIINCTIASNGINGISITTNFSSTPFDNTIKNTIIKDNANVGISNTIQAATTNTFTNSLIQGETSTANGNLVGTTNPQFVSPVANTVRSDAGDYRLKWCSKAINAGTNTDISPLDLDRNPRNFNGTADMGAYEFLGNTPSQVATSHITGTIDSPTYTGGAIQTITSTAKILAPAGAVDFKAPNAILLSPGFEARGMGKYFEAKIGANVACSN